MALTYIGIGILLAIVSFIDWAGRGSVVRTFGAAPAADGQTFRGILFGLWAVSLPLCFLAEWETRAAPPPANEMAAFTYGHKVISDAWTAVAAFAGVLFAIRKP